VSGNVSRTVTTDAAGHFSIPGMAPGRCVLHVEAGGFKAAETAIEAGPGDSAAITIMVSDAEHVRPFSVLL